jgi:hypothetical protein
LTDPASGIIALATSTASGDAGSVIAAAPQITIAGAEIASTTAGSGMGGSVMVTTPGALVLDGAGVANTQIAASATGPQSGPAGLVTVSANSLTVKGGAQIASSTAGPGKGGDVNITVASDIVLPDPGPQITAQSTGSGDAGSITVSAVQGTAPRPRANQPGRHRDLMNYNDDGDSYAEVRALIVEARAMAQAERDAAGDRRRTSTVIQPDRTVTACCDSPAPPVRERLTHP